MCMNMFHWQTHPVRGIVARPMDATQQGRARSRCAHSSNGRATRSNSTINGNRQQPGPSGTLGLVIPPR